MLVKLIIALLITELLNMNCISATIHFRRAGILSYIADLYGWNKLDSVAKNVTLLDIFQLGKNILENQFDQSNDCTL